ncbi:MAG: DUF3592 domain-containing protein [Verrucomicrobia bacterium]|nr:DUF3592 domain-containing protein [Verrucomicrobiota bacterium]
MPGSTSSARLLKTALGLGLIIPGAAFIVFLWISYDRAQETRHWKPTPCLILSSQVLSEHPSLHSPLAHRASVRYRYVFEGVTHTGDHIRRVDGPSSEKEKMEKLCAKYPPGRESECFVNPEQPDIAVLEHATKAGLYTLWFPLLFVAGGAGMIWSAWRRTHSQSSPEKPLGPGFDLP